MSQIHEKLIEAVVNRADSDRVFRQQLLSKPADAIRAAYGAALPAGFRVRFIETPANVDLLVVLRTPGGKEELTDDDLEKVAGGNDVSGGWAPPPPPPPGP
jgi:hypothetical protein